MFLWCAKLLGFSKTSSFSSPRFYQKCVDEKWKGNVLVITFSWNENQNLRSKTCFATSLFNVHSMGIGTSQFCPAFLWRYSSTSELFRLPEWLEETIASGQGSFGERSPLGSRFPESLFLDVPGKATEQVRTCGFRRNSSSWDRAPKIRDSVRLNSFESF